MCRKGYSCFIFIKGNIDTRGEVCLQGRRKIVLRIRIRKRRHSVFEHLNEIPLWHHCLIISRFEEFLLYFESCSLIDRIIEFRESISYLASCDDRLKSFHASRIFRRYFGKWRNNLRMVYKESWSSNKFTNVFPECISESFSVVSLSYFTPSSRSFARISSSVAVRRLIPVLDSTAADSRFLASFLRDQSMSFCSKYGFSVYFECDSLIEFLYKFHSIFVVSICPVEFHISKFLKMIRT